VSQLDNNISMAVLHKTHEEEVNRLRNTIKELRDASFSTSSSSSSVSAASNQYMKQPPPIPHSRQQHETTIYDADDDRGGGSSADYANIIVPGDDNGVGNVVDNERMRRRGSASNSNIGDIENKDHTSTRRRTSVDRLQSIQNVASSYYASTQPAATADPNTTKSTTTTAPPPETHTTIDSDSNVLNTHSVSQNSTMTTSSSGQTEETSTDFDLYSDTISKTSNYLKMRRQRSKDKLSEHELAGSGGGVGSTFGNLLLPDEGGMSYEEETAEQQFTSDGAPPMITAMDSSNNREYKQQSSTNTSTLNDTKRPKSRGSGSGSTSRSNSTSSVSSIPDSLSNSP
jgi:hypothetical protein